MLPFPLSTVSHICLQRVIDPSFSPHPRWPLDTNLHLLLFCCGLLPRSSKWHCCTNLLPPNPRLRHQGLCPIKKSLVDKLYFQMFQGDPEGSTVYSLGHFFLSLQKWLSLLLGLQAAIPVFPTLALPCCWRDLMILRLHTLESQSPKCLWRMGTPVWIWDEVLRNAWVRCNPCPQVGSLLGV